MVRRSLVLGAGVLVVVVIAGGWWHHAHRDSGPEATRPIALAGTRGETRGDPRTQGRASISGTITDEDRAPVPHARVCASATSDALPRHVTRDPLCTTADARGVYTIGNLLAAKHSVTAMARPFRPGSYVPTGDHNSRRFDLKEGERKTGVDVVLTKGGAEITGTVADLTGGPVAHASVRAELDDKTPGPAIEADDAGRFSLWVAPGTIEVTAEADGYVGGSDRGTAPGTLRIVLTPESSLSGTVVDSKTNDPIGGLEIEASSGRYTSWTGPPGDVTDEQGHFRIDHLRPARYVVLARGPHTVGSSEGSTLVGLGQHVDGVVVKVYPAARVEGRVVIAGNPPTPCGEPSVWLGTHVENVSLLGRGASDGTVLIDSVYPGTYEVSIRCKGFVSTEKYPLVEVKDKDVTGLTWEVVAGGTIRGRVMTKAGAPIAGATIATFGAQDGISDQNGRYELTAVGAGKHTLVAFGTTAVGPANGWAVELPERATVEKDLVLDDGGSIRGVIVDTDGKPIAGALVDVNPVAEPDLDVWIGRPHSVWSLDDGSFASELLPAGDYRITAERDRAELQKPGSADAQELRVAVHALQTSAIRFVVEPQSRSIRGTVTDAAGAPVTDAYVAAARESDANGPSSNVEMTREFGDDESVPTGLDGSFTVSRLSAGNYTVRAFRNGGGEAIAEHVLAGGSARLQIRPTASVEGTVHWQTLPPDEFFVEAYDAKTRLTRLERFFRTTGRYRVRDLPSGHYTVTVHTERRRSQATVDLGDGEHKAGVDITFDAGVTVTGRVVDQRTKQGVAGIKFLANLAVNEYTSMRFRDREPPVASDEAGRFKLEHVPSGRVTIRGYPTMASGYGVFGIVRALDGTDDVDVGDLGIVKRRLGPDDPIGTLGITWADHADDTPSDQRSFTVLAIDPAGPAAKTALQVGDVVTTIDGTDVLANNRSSGWTLLEAPPGTPIRFGLARGTSVTVVTVAR